MVLRLMIILLLRKLVLYRSANDKYKLKRSCMTTENWISIISIISGGCIGYLIKYSLDKRTLFSSRNAEIKREIYKDYVNTILKTVNEFQQQDGAPSKSQQERLIKELQNFHKKAVLYASPKVLDKFSNMLQHAYREYKDEENGLRTMVLMTAVFKEMRKDIGLSSRGLGSGGIRLLRPLINDYDKIIRQKEFLLYANTKLYLLNNKK